MFIFQEIDGLYLVVGIRGRVINISRYINEKYFELESLTSDQDKEWLTTMRVGFFLAVFLVLLSIVLLKYQPFNIDVLSILIILSMAPICSLIAFLAEMLLVIKAEKRARKEDQKIKLIKDFIGFTKKTKNNPMIWKTIFFVLREELSEVSVIKLKHIIHTMENNSKGFIEAMSILLTFFIFLLMSAIPIETFPRTNTLRFFNIFEFLNYISGFLALTTSIIVIFVKSLPQSRLKCFEEFLSLIEISHKENLH